jgi:hypothetical protein
MRRVPSQLLRSLLPLSVAVSVYVAPPGDPRDPLGLEPPHRRQPLPFPPRIEPFEPPMRDAPAVESALPEAGLPSPPMAAPATGVSTREAFRRRQDYLRRLRESAASADPPPPRP